MREGVNMKTILKIVVIFSFLATTSLVSAEIYNWVDDKGTVHFTEDQSTIPPKYVNQTKSEKTEEDHMTMEERIRAKQEHERRAKETMERNTQGYQMALEEENSGKAERQLKNAPEQKQAKQEKQVRKLEEATKKEQERLQEEEDSDKKCYNCDGEGYIAVEVAEMRGGVVSGRSFHGSKKCSICGGTGKLGK